MEEVKVKETWNKKRILAVLILIILLIAGIYFFKDRIAGIRFSFDKAKSVKGVSLPPAQRASGPEGSEKKTDIDIQAVLKEKLNDLKQEVSGLNITEIASSSPQIQKIINDIKSLEQYPQNQAKEICKQICGL